MEKLASLLIAVMLVSVALHLWGRAVASRPPDVLSRAGVWLPFAGLGVSMVGVVVGLVATAAAIGAPPDGPYSTERLAVEAERLGFARGVWVVVVTISAATYLASVGALLAGSLRVVRGRSS